MNDLIEFINAYLVEENDNNQEFYEKNQEFFDYEFTDEELTTDM